MIRAFNGKTPKIAESAFIAETAVIIGDVEIGEHASVWYNAVLRGDSAKIVVGDYSNVQDNVTIHVDEGHSTTIGKYVTIGHNAIVHGATVGDNSLIGMGAVLLNGSKVGRNCLVGASALMTENRELPDGCVAKGLVKEWRELSEESIAGIHKNALDYAEKARKYKND